MRDRTERLRWRHRSPAHAVLSHAAGLAFFVIILLILNWLARDTSSVPLREITAFLNANVLLIVGMTLLFMAADVFTALGFPLNIPAPLFNAAGAALIAAFVIRMFGLVGTLSGVSILDAIAPFTVVLCILVFVIVLVVGYVLLLIGPDEARTERPAGRRTRGRGPTWDDIGYEFRSLLYERLRRKRKER